MPIYFLYSFFEVFSSVCCIFVLFFMFLNVIPKSGPLTAEEIEDSATT